MGQPGQFVFHCPTPGCGRSYNARPDLVGRLMVCHGCGQKIRIPAPRNDAVTADSRAKNKPSKMPAAPAVQAKKPLATDWISSTKVRCPCCNAVCRVQPEWRGREIQCPTCSKPFVLSLAGPSISAPAGPVSHEEAVPEFEPDDTAETNGSAFDDMDAGFEIVDEPAPPPPPAEWNVPAADTTLQPAPGKKKKKRKNSLQFLEDIVDSTKLLFLFGILFALVLIVVGILFAPLALDMRIVGGLFTLCGFVYGVRLAFDESPVCGVFYFIDCTSIYRLYYTITRWSEMRHAFFAEVFGMLLCIPWAVLTVETVFDHLQPNCNADQFDDEDMEDLPPGWQQFGDPNNPAPGVQPPGNQPLNPAAAPVGHPPVPPDNSIPNPGQTAPGNP